MIEVSVYKLVFNFKIFFQAIKAEWKQKRDEGVRRLWLQLSCKYTYSQPITNVWNAKTFFFLSAN